ncbi:hypothetical protein QFN62_002614, partial [Enterococcus faecium]|nr:hypothetical protein [Enterococcus faecium]
DLGKLKKMYSNSIDFGGYDYSENPNLMKNVYSSTWSKLPNGSSQPNPYIKIFDDYIIIDATDPSADNIGRKTYVPMLTQLQGGKEYTMSVTMMVDDAFNSGGDSSYNNSAVHYAIYADGQEVRPNIIRPNTTMVNQYQRVSVTFTMPTNLKNVEYSYFLVYESKSVTGKWYIKNDIKIEEGSTATPYQPNLLDAPYYLSKVALGENIADPTAVFPISTSDYLLYNKRNIENYEAGQTYTLTMKATKPASQSFRVFIRSGTQLVGTMMPVEGKVDEWKITFTVSQGAIDEGTTNILQVYQYPNTSLGAVQIDWLKIEKGNTRTPNISQFKYFGEGLKDSNNPNDYSWDITPEYAEKSLNNTVSLTEPQSIEGLKNFEDGLQIAGKEVATVPEDTGWVNLTAINGHSWNKQGQIRRIGKLVMFRGSLKGSTLSTQDFCTIPEGFRPSNPTDNYEYQFLLPPQSSNTLDNGGMAYIRPNGVCGLPSFRGTVNLFLAPIQY